MKSSKYQSIYWLGPPFRDIDLDWWDDLERHTRAKEYLAEGEVEVAVWLANNASTRLLDVDVIRVMHGYMFGKIFPELAGKIRGPAPDYVPMWVEYGRRRGVDPNIVPDEMDKLARTIQNLISQLDTLRFSRTNQGFIDDLSKSAALAHCELIRIHPFPNGNGRTSRMCISYFCFRYGYLPIAISRPKGEYIEAVGAWIDHNDIEPCAELIRPLFRKASDSHR